MLYLETFVPWMHGFHRLIFEEMVEVGYNVTGVVIGNKGTPACAYTFTTIDQHHGYDWCIPASYRDSDIQMLYTGGTRLRSARSSEDNHAMCTSSERKNYKPCGFNRLPILFEIVQQNIISLNKQGSSNWRQTCENVSSTRMILPTLHFHTVDKSSQSHGTVYMMS